MEHSLSALASLAATCKKQVAAFAILSFCFLQASAQVSSTPGHLWTFVPPDSLPVEALDSVYLDSIYRSGWGPTELRYVYRIYCHPELFEVTDSNTFFIDVPRDPPDSTQLVEMQNPFVNIDSTLSVDFHSYYYSGFQSFTSPELNFMEINFEFILWNPSTTKDTVYDGRIFRGPWINWIKSSPNLSGDYVRYAYFIQTVDSVWHPQISATPEPPASALRLKIYPNPSRGPIRVDLPDNWLGGYDAVLRLYDKSGTLLLAKQMPQRNLQELHLLDKLPAGTYTLTVHNEQGELAVGRVMKGG